MGAGVLIFVIGLVLSLRRRSTQQVTRTVEPGVGERVTQTQSRTSGGGTV